MLANTPAMLECHYGVPMSGGVLHSINTGLDPASIAFQLDHAESKIVVVDQEFMPAMQAALKTTTVKPLLIQYQDCQYVGLSPSNEGVDYETYLQQGSDNSERLIPLDEWDAISINYTSGTTGNPKGAVSHHRGAYLLAQGNA
jgi:fatty-acyl-CoA synthase